MQKGPNSDHKFGKDYSGQARANDQLQLDLRTILLWPINLLRVCGANERF